MKNLLCLISLLLSCLAVSARAAEFWTPLNGPDLGQVFQVIEDNDGTLWATTRNALYRSHDNGHTWEQVRVTSGQYQIAISSKGTIIMAASQYVPTVRSDDRGEHWEKVDYSFTYVTASSAGEFFAASNGSMYRSTDEGKSWNYVENCPTGPAPGSISGLYNSPGDTLYLARNGRNVYRSSDRGETWDTLAPIAGTGISELIFYSGIGMIAATLHGLFYYDESIQEWIRFALANKEINTVRIQGNTLLAGLEDGAVVRSFDMGENWDTVGTESMGIGIVSLTLRTYAGIGCIGILGARSSCLM